MSTQPNRIPTRERLRSVREAPVSQKYAARFLNLHPKTVLRKAREGSLPAHPVGTDRKRWHFYLSDSLRWGWRQRQPVCSQEFPLRFQFDGILANLHGYLTLSIYDTSISVI